jgi:hypothetical protein
MTVKIGRSWGSTIGFGVLLVVSVACIYFLWMSHWMWLFRWGGLILCGFGALGGVGGVVWLSGAAPCPSCKRNISGIDTSGDTPVHTCEGCGAFFEVKAGNLVFVAPDYLADQAIFPVPLPAQIAWPHGCCVCRAPATRQIPVSASESQTGRNVALGVAGLAVGALVVRTGGGASFTIEVPHCEQHSDGAALEIKDASESQLEIKFRSVAFARDFQGLNVGQKMPG